MNFSIVCPTYNSSKFIHKTVDCLLNQTYHNFEVIFSDDGSTDNTLEILEKFRKKFVQKNINTKILKNKHNGPGFARNEALKYSSNQWISFIDSDDLWTDEKLEKVNKIVENNNEINCVLHRQNYIKINGKVKKHDFDKYYNPTISSHQQIFKSNFLAMSAVSIKKELILSAGGFNEDYLNAQDYDLWLKIGDKFKIYIIKEYLGSNLERKGNITSKYYFKRVKNLQYLQ